MTDHPQPGLLAPARRAHVLEALARDGMVRISRLTDDLGVAPVTLRRDLAQMEADGLLVRVHGGAVPAPDAPGAAAALRDGSPAGTDAALPAPGGFGGKPGQAGSIAVLVPSLSFYWPTVIRGMEAESQRYGVRLVPRGASYALQDERPVLERLIRSDDDVRGLIVAPNTDSPHAQDVVRWLAESGVPSVLVEREATDRPGGSPVESVVSDHAHGALLAVRHLAELGHSQVGLVLSRHSPTARKIRAGWAAGCDELRLTPAQHIEEVLPDRRSPEFSATVDAILDRVLQIGVTALLVHSDPEAMAFVDIALNRGLSVPGDLSIVAYDDEVAELFTPPMTAISPPRAAVGAAAVDLLMRRIADPTRPVHRVALNPSLNVRESTSRPRGR